MKKLKVSQTVNHSDYLNNYSIKDHEDDMLLKGIEKLTEESDTFQFLNDDEDIYTLGDIKEKY